MEIDEKLIIVFIYMYLPHQMRRIKKEYVKDGSVISLHHVNLDRTFLRLKILHNLADLGGLVKIPNIQQLYIQKFAKVSDFSVFQRNKLYSLQYL